MKKIKEGGFLGYKLKNQRKITMLKGLVFIFAMFLAVGTYASGAAHLGASELIGGGTIAMAILTDVETFEGDDAGLFLKPVTEHITVKQLGFDIIDDTVNTQFIYLNNEIDMITRLRVGCGFTETGTGTNIYRKAIAPVNLQAQLKQCADVFDETVFRKKMKKGADVNDLTGTEIEKMLIDFVTPVVTRDMMRILWLADTAHTDPNFNQMDGIYAKLAAGVIADGINSIGDITNSMVNTTNIITTLRSAVNGADRKLKQVPKGEKALYVTEPVFDGYKAWLQDNAQLESARKLTIDGIESLTFDGIELINLAIVTDYLNSHFTTGSPSTVTDPNRIVYMKKDNNVLVFDTVSRFNEVKFWYDPTPDLNYTRARYMMQYEYKYPELITVGGF